MNIYLLFILVIQNSNKERECFVLYKYDITVINKTDIANEFINIGIKKYRLCSLSHIVYMSN